jgi:hypothetical protein
MKRRVAGVPRRAELRRGLLTRGRITAVVTGLFAFTAVAGPAVANVSAPAKPSHDGAQCTPSQRRDTLAVEQSRVLKLLSGFRVLRNKKDLDRLAVPDTKTGTVYALLPHMFDSMKGIGITIVNVGVNGPGKPSLLFYLPDPHAKNVLDPFGADYPYRLVGWGYVQPYTPGQAPAFPGDPGLRCVVAHDSFVHERSVHPADTWQNIPVVTTEQYHGQDAAPTAPSAAECNCVVGLNHGRFWDTHFFLTGDRTPKVSMLNPGKPIRGFDAHPGVGFFYPQAGPR